VQGRRARPEMTSDPIPFHAPGGGSPALAYYTAGLVSVRANAIQLPA
jgi:hypothetical protein